MRRLDTFLRADPRPGAANPRILIRMRFGSPSLLLSATLLAVPASAAPPATGASKHVRVTLAPAVSSIQPGQPFWLGLRLEMDPRWHTYWKNPGDSGLPTRIRWTLPEGFQAGEIQWPRPHRFLVDPLMSYGYADEVWLLTEIRPPSRLTAPEAALLARVDWLECQEICIPGRAEIAIALPVKDAAPWRAEHAEAIERARALVPGAARFAVKASAVDVALRLDVTGVDRPCEAYFFPAAGGVIEHALPQKLEGSGTDFSLSLPRAANGAVPASLDGVLELDGHAYAVAVRIVVKRLSTDPGRHEGGFDR